MKVQRPNLETLFDVDLANLKFLAQLADRFDPRQVSVLVRVRVRIGVRVRVSVSFLFVMYNTASFPNPNPAPDARWMHTVGRYRD